MGQFRGYVAVSALPVALMLLLAAGCQDSHSWDLPKPTVRRVIDNNPRVTVTPPRTTPVISHGPAEAGIPADWLPLQWLEDTTRWQGIVIHHSAGDFGDAATFDKVHRQRGWDGLGYHFVINNGHNKNGKSDGLVEVGRRWRQQSQGAHCRPKGNTDNYWNEHTVGICLVGNFEKQTPTARQWQSLIGLVQFLQARYGISAGAIKGHREIMPTKCPGKLLSMWELRRAVTQQ